jgi:hypothetical protein
MLKQEPKHVIIPTLTATTVNITAGVIRIEGYGTFTAEQVISCYNECPAACTPQVQTVTVVVPESCECPYSWALRSVRIACTSKYDVQTTFNAERVYEYVSQDGSTPTATQVKDAIVLQVNNDPYRFVNAASTGGTTFTLTERDCDSLLGSCGIANYVTSGTVVTSTPHVNPVLPAWKMMQRFPIQWGMVGGNPNLGRCSGHCVFYFHIRGVDDIQDIDMSSTWSSYDREVYFYVNPDDPNYDAMWLNELAAELDCLTT